MPGKEGGYYTSTDANTYNMNILGTSEGYVGCFVGTSEYKFRYGDLSSDHKQYLKVLLGGSVEMS